VANGPTVGLLVHGLTDRQLIGRLALMSFNWQTYWLVRFGAYSFNK